MINFSKKIQKHEIDIDSLIRIDILEKLQYPGVDLFDDIQRTVQLCLESELYPKFLQSDQYKTYRSKAETHINGARSSPRESALKKRFTHFFSSKKGSSENLKGEPRQSPRNSTEGIPIKITDKELPEKDKPEKPPEKEKLEKHPTDKKEKRNAKPKTSIPKIMKNLLTKDNENTTKAQPNKDKLQDSMELDTPRELSELDSWDAYSVSSATNKSDFSSWSREKSLDSIARPTVSELEKQILESLQQAQQPIEEPEFIQF